MRQFIYGQAVVEGAGAFGGARNGELYQCITLPDREIGSIKEYFVDSLSPPNSQGEGDANRCLNRSSRLTAFLAAGSALPFVWGQRDCCFWVADWIKAERGVEVAAALRGTFATAAACQRLQRRHGGLEALVAGQMALAGLQETVAPQVGDVGLVETGVGLMLGICAGERWAVKSVEGIVVLPTAATKAWSV